MSQLPRCVSCEGPRDWFGLFCAKCQTRLGNQELEEREPQDDPWSNEDGWHTGRSGE